MYNAEEIAYIWLDSFFGADINFKKKLLNVCPSAYVFAADIDKYSDFLIKCGKDGVYNSIRDSLKDSSYSRGIVKRLESNGITAVTKCSKLYPKELAALDFPPTVLYCKGDLSLLERDKFSIVGSRRTLPNILKLTENLSEELSSYFTVVTGLADGGDSAVIAGAVKNKNVISVIPSSHDCVYPAANYGVYEDVCKNGLVISEYAFDFKPQKFTFPIRNRIIAALSKGVLAVSAGEKSGVLSTVYQALDLGKEVFAFPYSVGVECGVGCNSLIKKGAYLCENIVDILSCFGIDFKKCERAELSKEEEIILSALRNSEGMHVYEIANLLNKEISDISEYLFNLEINSLVVKLGGNRYSAV